MATGKQANTYVDLLMQEWRMGEASRIVQACVRQVLEELDGTAQLSLRREPKLEVMVLPESGHSVWAYFPIHRRRTIARQCKPKSATRVLLVLSEKRFQAQPPKVSMTELRDHLGHVLLYLRSPMARNECVDAEREWRSALRLPEPKKVVTKSAQKAKG
jgi:hypothetical protein